MTDDFSQAEIKRLTTAVDRLTETIVHLERRMAETYVRKDVYEADRKADAVAGTDLSKTVAGLTSVRDWAVKIVVMAVMLALLGLVLVDNGAVP